MSSYATILSNKDYHHDDDEDDDHGSSHDSLIDDGIPMSSSTATTSHPPTSKTHRRKFRISDCHPRPLCIRIIFCGMIMILVVRNIYISIYLPNPILNYEGRVDSPFTYTGCVQESIEKQHEKSSIIHTPFSSSFSSTVESSWLTMYPRQLRRIQAILSSSSEPMGSSAIFILCNSHCKKNHKFLEAYSLLDSFSWTHFIHTLPTTTTTTPNHRTIHHGNSWYSHLLLGHLLNPSTTSPSIHSRQFRWIGSFTWNEDTPEDYYLMMDSMINRMDLFQQQSSSSYPSTADKQVISFSLSNNTIDLKDFFSKNEILYPGWINLCKYILTTMGEPSTRMEAVMNSSSTTTTSRKFKFLGEFMTQPQLLHSFLIWIHKVWIILAFDVEIQQIIQDAKKINPSLQYNNNTYNTLSSIFILYPMLEHFLISYFFNTRGSTIMTLAEYHNHYHVSTSSSTNTNSIIPFMNPVDQEGHITTMTPSGQALKELLDSRREYYHNPRNPDSTPFVFILCQDENSCITANQVYSSYSWTRKYTFPITSTLLNEYYFFTHHLQDLLQLTNFNTHWIGILPWKDPLHFNVTWIDQMLKDPILIEDDGVDVLMISTTTSTTTTTTNNNNPLQSNVSIITLEEKFKYILLSLGESNDSVLKHWNLHSNTNDSYFIATRELMQSFISWISRTLLFTQIDPMCCQDMIDWTFLSKQLATYFFITRAKKLVSMSYYEEILVQRKQIKDVKELFAQHNNKMIQGLQSEADGIPLMFVLCHNHDSLNEAIEIYSNFTWAHIYILHTTFMMETYFYTNILESLMDVGTHHSTSWVGSISYKAAGKTYLSTIHKMLSDQSLINEGYDLLAFWTPLNSGDSMYSQTAWFHPGLMELINYILLSLGESQDNITRMSLPAPSYNAFFGNFFVCRPTLMRQYISWLNRVIIFLNTDPKAQRLVWKNSYYYGTEGVAEAVYNKTYYPFHPFIGERISSYFFNSRGAKIALVDSATGKYPLHTASD